MNTTAPSSELLDNAQAAAYLGISAETLPVWRSTKRYEIPFLKIGRNVRYRRADLDAFLESVRVAG